MLVLALVLGLGLGYDHQHLCYNPNNNKGIFERVFESCNDILK